MSNDNKPSLDGQVKQSGSGQASTPHTVEPNKTDALVELLLRQQARDAAKEEAEVLRKETRNKQRDINASQHGQKRLIKQMNCGHKKGGKNAKAGLVDFNVYIHTYINKEQVIRCCSCGMKWKAEDTVEFLVRNGRQIKNHTGKGWKEAVAMLSQTSNKPSTSEIPYEVSSSETRALPSFEGFEAQ